jgi:hypothetical protein
MAGVAQSISHWFRLITTGVFGLAYVLFLSPAAAQTNQVIYDDSLQNNWLDWSWATINPAETNIVHSGSRSLGVAVNAWQGLYFDHAAFDPSPFTNLTFWINGGTKGGQSVRVVAVYRGSLASAVKILDPLPANSWRRIDIPLAVFLVPGQARVDGFWIQDWSGGSQPTFFVDDVVLEAGTGARPGTNAAVTVQVDARAQRHPIHPEIYGVAFASSNQLIELNAPLNRYGGNSSTRYNWQLNATSHAADWYFESLSSASSAPGAEVDDLIAQSKTAGARALITVPMIDRVARLGPNRERLASFSIAKYGPQTGRDPYFPDAGNGVASATGLNITNNDPDDANLPVDVNFQAAWVEHLIQLWNRSTNGGVGYYLLDNEPSLWHSTHRDAHPVGETMQEERDKAVRYARMIKGLDPDALVAGPEEWGWQGYFYSGFDQQWMEHHQGPKPDRAMNGGKEYLPWFLDQMRRQSASDGRRLLDIFTVHYYPQSDEFGRDVSPAMQLLRNRSTRSLWDTNYVDQSWIHDKVMLIPRLRQWVEAFYPGTRIGITEYNWGAENHINGATAQADVLGIFGRENLDLATRWTVPDSGTPVFNAFKMYRNYDGKNSTFGDVSVSARAPDPDQLSVFAALRASDGSLTIMVINKVLAGVTPVALQFTNFSAGGRAQVWQLTQNNLIVRHPDARIANRAIENFLPAQSITLLLVPAAR